MRTIAKSSAAFEAWMRHRTDVSGKLLKRKHRKMSSGPFPFLRATFYRWVEQWPAVCPNLAGREQDVLLAARDLHVENFGVWLDSRQRLVCDATGRMVASTRADHAAWAKEHADREEPGPTA
jgi:uncharacterized protein DUF2252